MRSGGAWGKEVGRTYGKPVLILAGVYALGISAILRADFYYIDDMARAFWGYRKFQ